MTNDPTTAYFDNLAERAIQALVVPRTPWSEAQPNRCHANAEAFVLRFSEYQVVRGWLVNGGHWFIPHSVVRRWPSGQLVDVTPDPTNSGGLPFVEHLGTEEEYRVLRRGRDGGWLHPPVNLGSIEPIGETDLD